MESRQVICNLCKDGREDECLGTYKHYTFCDSQHKKRGFNVDPLQCHHVDLNNTHEECPTCGKANDSIQQEEIAEATRLGDDGKNNQDGSEATYDISPGAFIEGPYEGSLREISSTLSEEERDRRDNFS